MNILDDLFHGCALEAWLEIAEATGQWPPDSESVRRRAYELYEAALRERHEENPVDKHVEP
ncbi:hypothetical protein [Humisphaera borealis]|jgi:hypothetical protein|uniref:Uncharacterized protein n=1 Tax=Humisphaera borealis TaxID=2807512 RepID=A0A7M2X353_9BACT|nr:hypothetical protein [Humisphaera borealis]QOV92104.1 hypothetical protein IPV69_12415 [Humisphaera borealis]